MKEEKVSIDMVLSGLGHTGNIYIGNYSAANNKQLLKNLSIRSIITVARGLFLNHDTEDIPNYLYLPADDTSQQDIHQYFQTAFEFIEKHKKRTNILVHCFSGISRSTTIVIAYLSKKYNYEPKEAIMILRIKRSKINPNKNFIRQLEKYYEALQQNKVLKQKQPKNSVSKNELRKNLSNLRENCEEIENIIESAKQKIIACNNRKRSTSEFLKRRLSQKHENSLKKMNPMVMEQMEKSFFENTNNVTLIKF